MRRVFALAALALSASLVAAPRSAAAAPGSASAPPPSFPCPGCVVHVPARLPEGPRPLLVVLHGDGGAIVPLVRAFQPACDEAGVILLAPRCPRETGCTAASYWQWLQDARHDERWLGGLIDAVAERWPIDPTRVYAAGYSGGATYLGWYVPTHPLRFAAVAHIAGGAPYGKPCPACKVPVLFTIGGVDPMIVPYTAPLRAYYDDCGGHEVVWQTLPGVTHEGIVGTLQAGRAKEVLGWLLARPRACAADPPDAGVVDAGESARSNGSSSDAGASTPPPSATPAAAPEVPHADPPARIRPKTGCACSVAAAPEDGAWIAATALIVGATRRRRQRTRRRW